MLYVSFCKEVESQWASLKQTSEVYFARYHLTTGLPLSVGYLVVNSVIYRLEQAKETTRFRCLSYWRIFADVIVYVLAYKHTS